MKAVLLCAGYGTRLSKSIENDGTGKYNHLKSVPKPLLPIGGKPLLSHWIEMLLLEKTIGEIVIVTNMLHQPKYEELLQPKKYENVSIICDGSSANEDRSGAVACMNLGIAGNDESTIFIAGDTLFSRDFRLAEVISHFNEVLEKGIAQTLILSAPVDEQNVSKHGIIEVDFNGIVQSFLEKPHPSETKSRLQSPCFYIMNGKSLQYMQEFLTKKKDNSLTEKDATGKFIEYLITMVKVYAFKVSTRYDIGDLNSYIECLQAFELDDK